MSAETKDGNDETRPAPAAAATAEREIPRGAVFLLGAAAGAAGAALLAAFPAALAWGFCHPPKRRHHRNPRSALGLAYERIRLRARDGVTLSAWYVPAAAAAPRGVVVICHGYFGNRAAMLPHLDFLHRAGYAAVLFDWRAHGWSGGRRTTFGVAEKADLTAALDWVSARPELRDLPLALVGESMGASIALLVAADEPERVRAVVADSAYARFDSAVDARLRLVFGPAAAPVLVPPTQRAGEVLMGLRAGDIAPEEAMPRIAPRPVLLIHGDADRVVPPENAERLLAASPGNAALWTIPGAAHVRGLSVAGDEYARRVMAFLDESLASSVQ